MLAAIALVCSVGFTLVHAVPSARADAGPSCDAARPAVAFFSDGTRPTTSDVVLPCVVTTGYGAAETQIEVAPNGDIAVTPAMTTQPGFGFLDPEALGMDADSLPGERRQEAYGNGAGIAYSSDRGSSWRYVEPGGRKYACCDDDLYIDPVSGRLFFSAIFGTAGPGPLATAPSSQSAVMSASYASGYKKWNGPVTMPGHIAENPRFTAAPPPAGQRAPAAGGRMAYWCANGPGGPQARLCYRSFDNGGTWKLASVFSQSCPQATGIGGAGPYPHAAPDGTLWAACGTNLLRSADEAGTWPIVKTLPVAVSGNWLRVDSKGTLYLLNGRGNDELLYISLDRGASWRGPFNMTPPALRASKRTIGQLAFSIGYRPGDVTISFLFEGRPGGGQDAYISASHNANDVKPLFYAAMINPPTRAMVTAVGSSDDFIDNAIASDGTPYGAFYSDCQKDAKGHFTDPSCKDAGGKTYIAGAEGGKPAQETSVGSLRWQPPPPKPAPSPAKKPRPSKKR